MSSDIIDTESSRGDVNKMLLGSFVEEYDIDDGNSDDTPGTLSIQPESPYLDTRILSSEQSLQASPPQASPFPPPSRRTTQLSTAPTLAPSYRPRSSFFSSK